ncbi:MAG: oligosaccharide flippase family protein [Saprospiraceae bacterium]
MNLKQILDRIRNSNERSKRAYKNLSVSFVANVISLSITFFMVPITLNYVGKAEYGVWLTISSIVTWFSFFDIGLGNGLRNKLAVAAAENDFDKVKTYISSAYFLISGIALFLFIVFFVVANLVSWNDILNTHFLTNELLLKIVIIIFFFFCLSFSLKTISSILEALQLYAIKDIISVGTQIIGLIAILILINNSEGSLLYLSMVYGSQTAFGLLIASLVLFSGKLKHIRPSFQKIKIKESIPLINLGIWFFLNQILYLVTTQISLFLVIQFFGPEDVTVFNLAKNYMAISTMLFVMVLTPFLSAFTEAYTKADYIWIKSTMNNIFKAFAGATFMVVIMIIGYKLFFNLWVDGKVMPDLFLIITLGIFGVFQMYSSVYTLFLNGIGKIRLQFYTLLLSAILFIPLVYLFHYLDFGLSSLVLPGIIFGLLNSYIYSKQFNLIMEKKDMGIWTK